MTLLPRVTQASASDRRQGGKESYRVAADRERWEPLEFKDKSGLGESK